MHEGDNATFTCSLSNIPESFVLNWYRMSPRNQTDKLAAFQEDRIQPGPDKRFHVTRLPSGRDFHMSIAATRVNDSGTYFCGAIYLPPNTQINESPRAELTVKGVALKPQDRGAGGSVGTVGRDSPGSCPALSTPRPAVTNGPSFWDGKHPQNRCSLREGRA